MQKWSIDARKHRVEEIDYKRNLEKEIDEAIKYGEKEEKKNLESEKDRTELGVKSWFEEEKEFREYSKRYRMLPG